MVRNATLAAARIADRGPGRSKPLIPSRVRLDPDRLVGLACLFALPIALWFA